MTAGCCCFPLCKVGVSLVVALYVTVGAALAALGARSETCTFVPCALPVAALAVAVRTCCLWAARVTQLYRMVVGRRGRLRLSFVF